MMAPQGQISNPEGSWHRYGAEASLLSAQFRAPIATEVPRQAHVVLAKHGKYTHQAAGPFQLAGVLSFGSGYTQVAGSKSASESGFTTLATSVVEKLNILDVVTADRVVGQVQTVHPVVDGYFPSVSFLGTRFENLRINGNRIDVEEDVNVLGPRPASGRSYFEDPGVRERIAHQSAALHAYSELPYWAADELPAFRDEKNTRKIKCSLIRRVGGAPGRSFGHVIEVPDFGRIFLGELTVEEQDRLYIFRLSMIRMQLDSSVEGSVHVVDVVCNGGPSGEGKTERGQGRDTEPWSYAEAVMREDKGSQSSVDQPESPDTREMAALIEPAVDSESLPDAPAYLLLLVTAVCIGAAYWLVLSEGGAAVVRPAATIVIAGLAAGLVCVSTRDTRFSGQGQWALAVYSWILTAFAGAATSLGLFTLALLAFPRTAASSFQYAGLGLFGAVTGYLGASFAMAGVLRWGRSVRSPLDQVSREIRSQVEQYIPSLQPQVNRLLEEVILGPPIPPYNGFLVVMSTRTLMATDSAAEQSPVDLTLWFDTVRSEDNAPAVSGHNPSRRKFYPVILRGQGSRADNHAEPDKKAFVPFDVILHIPTVANSPIRRSVPVPLSGQSAPQSFLLQPGELEKGSIPIETLLELRCRGALIQIIDLHHLDRSAND